MPTDRRVLAVNSARMEDHSFLLSSFLAAPGPFGVANYWGRTPHFLHCAAQERDARRSRVSSHLLLAWRGPADGPASCLPAAAPWNGLHYGVTTSAPLDAAAARALVRQVTRRLGRLQERAAPPGAAAALDAHWLKHLRRVDYVPDQDVLVVTDGERLGVVRGGDAPPLHIACDAIEERDGIGDAPEGAKPAQREEAVVASMPCMEAAWRAIAPSTALVVRDGRVRRAASGARRFDPLLDG